MNRLAGKVALVTGGNSGIGLATAKRFVDEGAHVFVTGRRSAQLTAAVKVIGKNVIGVQADVSKPTDLDRLFDQIRQQKGRLDIVFANAGVAKYAPLGEISEELYDWMFDSNVKGVLFTVQKALPLLSDGASIILNASIAASKGCLRAASTVPPRPPCVRLPGPGPRTSYRAAFAFVEYRRDRAFHAWKQTMWAKGCRLPTQVTGGRALCFCGAAIGIADMDGHVYAARMEVGDIPFLAPISAQT